MKKEILISVIIPVYNTGKYLRKCIESIINQDLTEVEIILIDDGSTDDSSIICHNYERPFISYIKQPNQGLSVTRNNGIQYANGKYIMFIDSDDYIAEGSIVEIKNIISKREPDIILGQIEAFQELNVKREFYESDLSADMNKLKTDEIVLCLSCLNINLAPSVRYIIKQEFLKKHNLYFKSIPYEDVEWSTRVLAKVESIYIYNKKFYKYRLRSNSLSSSQNFEMYYTYTKIVKSLYMFSFSVSDTKKKEFVHNRCRYLLYRIRNEIHRLSEKERNVLKNFFENNSELIQQLYRF